MKQTGKSLFGRPALNVTVLVIAMIALPAVVWKDMLNVTDSTLRRQSIAMDTVVSGVRQYYTDRVVSNLSASDPTEARHDYHDIHGAIPIPATLAIELGEIIENSDLHAHFRFVSDYPFENRSNRALSPAEADALTLFRQGDPRPQIFRRSDENTFFNHAVEMMSPIFMEQTCVTCHNTHPLSPKTDWQVGDVRGVQSIVINQPIAANIFAFKWLLTYMLVFGTAGLLFSVLQFRMASRFRVLNSELENNNAFLEGISAKLSRYLSPQIYRSIFSGEKDVEISTERKKLTVFFSDIKDFTETTESLQPEELTELLNEYFTEMSWIAEKHGGTIDKFIGDAIVAFFGDPHSKGVPEDARACVRMALEMQSRLGELSEVWKDRGIEHPFRARIGINTGYCNVGNFGSDTRMDYTIIGAEANLAARLESSAPPGGIVISYETYAHVRDLVEATPKEPMRFKGIPREVIPYEVQKAADPGQLDAVRRTGNVLTIDLDQLDKETRAKIATVLKS